jgi:transcriptional regulator with XRE-family HTH domain
VPASIYPAANSPTVNARPNISLGRRLENFRLEKDFTYEELGTLAGVSRMSVVRACQGKRLTARITFKLKRFLKEVHA